ncbi:MAG: non-canonical purine NTP pyrophosphatase [Patescibacteria group bacterium]|jgi:XTP/dITP diphosphohydrolase
MKINKLLIATHNPGKFVEMKRQLKILGIEVLSLDDLNIKEDFEETANTYEENALGKAKFYYNITKIPTLADDSGLSVDALDGAPGINSRSWPGYRGSDEELLKMLLDKLKNVPKEKRTAKFISVIVLYNGQETLISRGEEPGIIAEKQISKLEKGLPYSAVFYPRGYNKVFSELTIDEKNAISHRGRALDQIIKQIKQ